MFSTLFLAVLLSTAMPCTAITIQANASEFRLRRHLLTTHDPMVRPVLQSPMDKAAVNVSFSAKLVSIIGVDNKKQMVTSKVFITQKWINPHLIWNKTAFDGLDRIRLSSNRVWVPDVKLQNNAINPTLEHGNLPLFKSWVTVYSNGTNIWMSLEMIDSECDIDVQQFPFDTQTCGLNFSSESYDCSLLVFDLDRNPQTNEELKSVPSGEWAIQDGTWTLSNVTRPCCPVAFVSIEFQLKMSRKRTFYILYFLLPCVVLALLMFISFVIPPESGERIGFCSSLLLALSVYLLILSDLLPITSNISLIGLLFVVVFLETALALLATVLVLKTLHCTSKVPTILKILFCHCGTLKKLPAKIKRSFPARIKQRLQSSKIEESPNPELQSVEDTYSTSVSNVKPEPVDPEEQKDENQRHWAHIARKLDLLFFWIFIAGLSTSVFAITINIEYVKKLFEKIENVRIKES